MCSQILATTGIPLAVLRASPRSIGVEIDHEYCQLVARYLKAETRPFFQFKADLGKDDRGGRMLGQRGSGAWPGSFGEEKVEFVDTRGGIVSSIQ